MPFSELCAQFSIENKDIIYHLVMLKYFRPVSVRYLHFSLMFPVAD